VVKLSFHSLRALAPAKRASATGVALTGPWGKGAQTVQLELSTNDVNTLKCEQLRAMASSARPPVEGEATVVTGLGNLRQPASDTGMHIDTLHKWKEGAKICALAHRVGDDVQRQPPLRFLNC